MKKKVLCVVGTRPEVIKMAPVIAQFKQDPHIALKVMSTAQHREMLDQMLALFQIIPDIDLDLMDKGQTLSQLTAKLPEPLDRILREERPAIVLAQGDTTTALMVSLACYYQRIPFAHVEAGLRTGNFYTPFPEEMNRKLISQLATLNFAPTEKAKENLLKEGYPDERVFVTGNTVIDALQSIAAKGERIEGIDPQKKLIVATAHRRENWGAKIERICDALLTLIEQNPEIQALFPVHPNPKVKRTVFLKCQRCPRIVLTDPLPYPRFIMAMRQAYFILSDSGGVQEEASALGVPVLILRDETERPEVVEEGGGKLVGTDPKDIIREAQNLLDHPERRQSMILSHSPFGDGRAAERIVSIIYHFLKDAR